MKKELRRRKVDALNDWCIRIALYFSNKTVCGEELYEVLHELSVKSYIQGTSDSFNAMRKK